ncbi:MAG: hypothetical protein VKJ64_18390 [Leptolyngbyaceae bacterium]|nr:hypothetical protein [Leptolyngbyaceae bacterium]
MTQSTLSKKTQPLGDAQPAYKVGDTGNTVVYIFPSGNACVKKGKKEEVQSVPVVVSQPQPLVPLQSSSAVSAQSIGDRLVQAGLITANQLQVALYDQQSMNLDLSEVLSARGWIDEATFQTFLSA